MIQEFLNDPANRYVTLVSLMSLAAVALVVFFASLYNYLLAISNDQVCQECGGTTYFPVIEDGKQVGVTTCFACNPAVW